MSQDVDVEAVFVTVKAEPEWENDGAEPSEICADDKCDVKKEQDISYMDDKSEEEGYIKYDAEDTSYLEPKKEVNFIEVEVEKWANEEDVPCTSCTVKEEVVPCSSRMVKEEVPCTSRTVKEEVEVSSEEFRRPKPLLATQGLTQQRDQNEQADETISSGNKHTLTLQSDPVGEKLHKCTYCSYATDIEENIKRHVKIHYRCVRCNFRAKSEVNLQIHVKNDCGQSQTDKRYKCAYCSYTNANICPLKAHERKHTGEKPFKCSYCSYTSARQTSLKEHIRTHHSGPKPYKCAYCSYACASKSYMEVHQRIHTGEKPFKCAYCSYACAHKQSLKRHKCEIVYLVGS